MSFLRIHEINMGQPVRMRSEMSQVQGIPMLYSALGLWTGIRRGATQAIRLIVVKGWQVHPGDARPTLLGGLLFGIVLGSLMILRPLRDTLGMARGIEANRRLFLYTVGLTLLVTPLFGWLASCVPRRRLIAIVFRICSVLLMLFYAGLTWTTDPWRSWVASGYYFFYSVFNLLVVSLFWAFMADHFSLSESKRLFPMFAFGGSIGAILGSVISGHLAHYSGIGSLFLPAAALLEIAVWISVLFTQHRSSEPHVLYKGTSLGGHWWASLKAVCQSAYLRQIGGYVAMTGMISTFLYFTGLRLVANSTDSPEQQTVLFASFNLWTQVATLLAQTFLAGRIMRYAGVGIALAILPMIGLCGAMALALAPTILVFTLANAVFRAVQQGVAVPAQETLFTVLNREDKYKAKSFLDTFGFRSGDMAGAHFERVVSLGGSGAIPFAVSILGLTALWTVLGHGLGKIQNRLACILPHTQPDASTIGSASHRQQIELARASDSL